ncbi:hypothetical protein B0T24DRAFT_695619, partial [Lasiosphaeria ovina]
ISNWGCLSNSGPKGLTHISPLQNKPPRKQATLQSDQETQRPTNAKSKSHMDHETKIGNPQPLHQHPDSTLPATHNGQPQLTALQPHPSIQPTDITVLDTNRRQLLPPRIARKSRKTSDCSCIERKAKPIGATAAMYECYDINPGVVLQSIERDFDETETPARPTSPRAPSSDDSSSSTHQASSDMLASATQTPDTDDSSGNNSRSTNEDDDAAPPLAKQRRRFAGKPKKSSLPPLPPPPRTRGNRCRRRRRERCQRLFDEPRRNGSSSSSGLGILSWPPCSICGGNMTFDEYTAELMYCKRCEGFQVHSG